MREIDLTMALLDLSLENEKAARLENKFQMQGTIHSLMEGLSYKDPLELALFRAGPGITMEQRYSNAIHNNENPMAYKWKELVWRKRQTTHQTEQYKGELDELWQMHELEVKKLIDLKNSTDTLRNEIKSARENGWRPEAYLNERRTFKEPNDVMR